MSGNSIGHLFVVTSFGESHGPAIGCVVDGCPPGLELSEADLQQDLDRRRPGQSKYVTQRKEPDTVRILSGVYQGRTTGTPIALLIENLDQRSYDYDKIVDVFRPNHADYAYVQKYGFRDPRAEARPASRRSGCASNTASKSAATWHSWARSASRSRISPPSTRIRSSARIRRACPSWSSSSTGSAARATPSARGSMWSRRRCRRDGASRSMAGWTLISPRR
jgi:hypothetical protein